MSQSYNIECLRSEHSEALEQFLTTHPASSMFIYSNMQRVGLDYTGDTYSGEYFAVRCADSQKIQGLLVHCWNGMLLMQCPELTQLAALCRHFSDNCTRTVAGVIGLADQAKCCIDTLALNDADYNTHRDESLMSLQLDQLRLPNPSSASLTMKKPSEPYSQLLHEWLADYEIEALNGSPGAQLTARVQSRVEGYLAGEDGWLLFDGEEPVAFSGFNARAGHAVQVGPVWTPPKYRNRGYARQLLAKTLQQAKVEGNQTAVLFTDSPAALRAYEALGFETTDAFTLALLSAPIDWPTHRSTS